MRDQPAVSDKPVFLDQTGHRWKLIRIVLVGLATGFCLIPFLLALSILNVEVLPEQSSELAQQITPASPPGYAARVRRLRVQRIAAGPVPVDVGAESSCRSQALACLCAGESWGTDKVTARAAPTLVDVWPWSDGDIKKVKPNACE
jgi:hypothetical protein